MSQGVECYELLGAALWPFTFALNIRKHTSLSLQIRKNASSTKSPSLLGLLYAGSLNPESFSVTCPTTLTAMIMISGEHPQTAAAAGG